MSRLNALLWHAAWLGIFSAIPGVRADCPIDEFGVEHCRLSTGARIGIAITIIVLAMLLFVAAMSYRQRRMRPGVAYINTTANAQSMNYNGQPGNYYPNPAGSPAPAPAYYGGGPTYPPPIHGYDAQYTAPSGPPPGYFPPPQGTPPGKEPM